MANPWEMWSQWIFACQEIVANLDTQEQDNIRMRAQDLVRQNIRDTATFWVPQSRPYQNEVTWRKAVFELLASQQHLQLLEAPQAFSDLVHAMVQEGALTYQPLTETEGPMHPDPSQLPFVRASSPAPVPAGSPAPNVVPGPDPAPEHVPEEEAAIGGNDDAEEADPEEADPEEEANSEEADPEEAHLEEAHSEEADPEEFIVINLTGEFDDDSDEDFIIV